jgi:hypothetical protein
MLAARGHGALRAGASTRGAGSGANQAAAPRPPGAWRGAAAAGGGAQCERRRVRVCARAMRARWLLDAK